ncbi:MAG TPA: DUF4347 domain-containing protein, partial [Steroidobacter sp.]|nr:DUF4347 domain-containing protein [Steroidobacter sp.]
MKKTTSQVASKVRNGASRKQAGAKVSRTMLVLEPRFMFDAAGMATAADAASHALPDDAYVNDVSDGSQDLVAALADHDPAAAQSGATQQRVEIVFIDTAIKDWTVLRDSVRDGAEVVLLDPTRNGLEQMEQALAGRSDIDALHVFSHGSDGQVELGNFKLNSNNIDAYAETLGRIGAALTSEGDLLLYGCDVASDRGEAFIEKLAAATGADVAASRDATGAADLGGNWVLETTHGEIETVLAFQAGTQQQYQGLLAAGTLTFHVSQPPEDVGTVGVQLGTVVTDEMGVTSDIPGITYQIYTADSGSPGVSNGISLQYWDGLLSDEAYGVKSGILGDDANGDPIIVIKSADGSQFDFRGLAVVNYIGAQTRVRVEGFRDGVSTGSVALDIDNANWNSSYGTAQLTRSIFQNVDEVRITNPDEVMGNDDQSFGYVNYIAVQNLVFGEPVGAPVLDANGAAGGTANTTTFT